MTGPFFGITQKLVPLKINGCLFAGPPVSTLWELAGNVAKGNLFMKKSGPTKSGRMGSWVVRWGRGGCWGCFGGVWGCLGAGGGSGGPKKKKIRKSVRSSSRMKQNCRGHPPNSISRSAGPKKKIFFFDPRVPPQGARPKKFVTGRAWVRTPTLGKKYHRWLNSRT